MSDNPDRFFPPYALKISLSREDIVRDVLSWANRYAAPNGKKDRPQDVETFGYLISNAPQIILHTKSKAPIGFSFSESGLSSFLAQAYNVKEGSVEIKTVVEWRDNKEDAKKGNLKYRLDKCRLASAAITMPLLKTPPFHRFGFRYRKNMLDPRS
jgi:hypothetical protein